MDLVSNILSLSYILIWSETSIHSSCNSTSPRSTFWSLRNIFWTIFPLCHTILLSSDKQFCLLACIFIMTVPSGSPPSWFWILMASRNGSMWKTASPILSSLENQSLSYTIYIITRKTNTQFLVMFFCFKH